MNGPPTREQELWSIALWLDRKHGVKSPEHIRQQVERLALAGDRGGVELWQRIADRYDQLFTSRSTRH